MCGVDPKFTPSATRLELQTLELLPFARRNALLAPRPFHWYLNRNPALPPHHDPDFPVGQQFPFANFNGIGSMSVKQLIVTTPSPPNNLSLSTNKLHIDYAAATIQHSLQKFGITIDMATATALLSQLRQKASQIHLRRRNNIVLKLLLQHWSWITILIYLTVSYVLRSLLRTVLYL